MMAAGPAPMESPSEPPAISRKPWLHRKSLRTVVAVAVLLLGLLSSLLAAWQVRRAIQEDALRQFSAVCDSITLKIRERLTAYAVLLQGGQGLFAASASVERDEWRTYIETVNADQTVPGYEGIGFSILIAPEDLERHEQSVRAQGFPDYRVRPEGPREVYSSIVYLEPFRDRNLLAFGYDMFSEPVRRQAMEKARDTGLPALSGKVTLIQEGAAERVQAGTLLYVPVYRNGAPTGTVGQRRAALLGWVYSPYRMEDLMRGIIPDWSIEGRSFVDLHIFDGTQADDDNLLFDSQPDGRHHRHRTFLHEERNIDFHGQDWLLVFDGSQAAGQVDYLPVWLTAAGGFVISGLLFGMFLLLFKRADAQSMAEGYAEQIRGMAYHDSLTKLPNRRLLRDRLDMALAAGRRQDSFGALMLLDLDNFKPLNDQEGHAAGDALLKEVAHRLHACVRETDTLVRLGGDEFVVLLPTLDREAAAARAKALEVAEKVRTSLAQPYRLDPEGSGRAVEHRCSCSIGLVLFDGHASNQSAIIKRADDAMYQAKKLGRNRTAVGGSEPAAA